MQCIKCNKHFKRPPRSKKKLCKRCYNKAVLLRATIRKKGDGKLTMRYLTKSRAGNTKPEIKKYPKCPHLKGKRCKYDGKLSDNFITNVCNNPKTQCRKLEIIIVKERKYKGMSKAAEKQAKFWERLGKW